MELVGTEAAAANAGSLLQFFRERGAPTVHLQHLAARPDATFFLPETEGAEINAAVAPSEDEAVVIKHYPNGFRDTGLLEQLRKREVDSLVIFRTNEQHRHRRVAHDPIRHTSKPGTAQWSASMS